MINKYFPFNYKPIYSLDKTRKYISNYSQLLFKYFNHDMQSTYVDLPIITNAMQSWNSYDDYNATINFDNNFNFSIGQFYQDPSSQLQYILSTSDFSMNDSIFTYGSYINRQANTNKLESIISQNFYYEIKVLQESIVNKQLTHMMESMWNTINNLNHHDLFHGFYKVSYQNKKIHFIDFDKFIKIYPFVNLNVAITEYTKIKGPTCIVGAYKTTKNNRSFIKGSYTSIDLDNSMILFVYDEEIKSALPIISVALRPTKDIIYNQLKNNAPSIIKSNVFNKTVLNKDIKLDKTIGMKIFFSNLMLINLKKYHLSEVVHSVWSDDFIKYVTTNHIKIF